MIAKNIKENISMRCDYLSIRALHPESLVNPFSKKCVVVAQRLSTFGNDIIQYINTYQSLVENSF